MRRPTAGGERDRIRVLLIVEAASVADVNQHLDDDPGHSHNDS